MVIRVNSKLKIVTFNIRCVWKGNPDGKNSFIHRAGMIYDKIMQEKPDVIMFQEFSERHCELMKRMLSEYTFVGQPRESDYHGEGLYTAVLNERIQITGYECYWLSPTPYLPGSRYEIQSVCPRICIVTKIRDTYTNKVMRTVNIHLDHISDEAKIQGIKQVLDTTGRQNLTDNIPTIIAGDFNAEPESDTINYCNNYDKLKLSDVTRKIKISFHGFGKASKKIDYIYVNESVKNAVSSVHSWTDCDDGIYMSDHYPICMEINIDEI